MGLWVVDPNWYFSTAAVVGEAVTDLSLGVSTLRAELSGCNSMAGNDPYGTQWGGDYDAAMRAFMKDASLVAEAWSSLAGRVYQAGVNHEKAEWAAGRGGQMPTAANLPKPPPISEMVPVPPPSAVGYTGKGLEDVLPDLMDAIGVDVPNAHLNRLQKSGDALRGMNERITKALNKVSEQVKRPHPSLPDAMGFYDELMGLNAPVGALGTDATRLGEEAIHFRAATIGMRQGIQAEVASCAGDLGMSANPIIMTARVVGGWKTLATAAVRGAPRIKRAGDTIRGYINSMNAAASALHAFAHAVNPMFIAQLTKSAKVPVIDIEYNDDGTVKSQRTTMMSYSKWQAWQRYTMRGGKMTVNEWSEAYERITANREDGAQWNDIMKDVWGYDPDQGWQHEYTDPVTGQDRRWDFANPDSLQLVENKHGALDMGQLPYDDKMLRQGWTITYNLNSQHQYSTREIWALQALADKHPGKVTINYN